MIEEAGSSHDIRIVSIGAYGRMGFVQRALQVADDTSDLCIKALEDLVAATPSASAEVAELGRHRTIPGDQDRGAARQRHRYVDPRERGDVALHALEAGQLALHEIGEVGIVRVCAQDLGDVAPGQGRHVGERRRINEHEPRDMAGLHEPGGQRIESWLVAQGRYRDMILAHLRKAHLPEDLRMRIDYSLRSARPAQSTTAPVPLRRARRQHTFGCGHRPRQEAAPGLQLPIVKSRPAAESLAKNHF